MTIRKATVLGAGVMGSQIAALLVNAGIKVQLLDVVIDEEDRNKLSKAGYDRITNKKKSMLYDLNFEGNLSYGNFADDLVEPSDSDIFIEAVKEDIKIKHDIWTKIKQVAKEEAILATNTSGIPIEAIAKVFESGEQERFLGMHFFNPPRYMKLLEIIPTKNTSEETVEVVKQFSEDVLGKGVVIANDVPAFIANRTGTHAMADIMYRAERDGLSIVEVDALTGKAIGRPRTGTYGLSDLVGNDIAAFVVGGLMKDPSEQPYFNNSSLLPKLLEKGALGNKAGYGFYKKEGRKRLVLDPETMEYVEPSKPQLEILSHFGRDLKENLDVIFKAEDKAGKFLWETLRSTFFYAANNVPKAAKDYKDIDRAMVWGFNWKVGPFQLWDLMGFDRVKERIQAEVGELPEWVANRTESFYKEGEVLENITPIEDRIEKEIWKDADTTLSVINTDQLLFKFHTPNNTIDEGLTKGLIKAVDELESGHYSGMVIYSDGPHFSPGANLNMMKKAIELEEVDTLIGKTISELHEAVNRVRYSSKPIVTAVRGRALGGGAELMLASPYVVAAAESYIGLVEVGVGLIPGGGGLAELTERVMTRDEQKASKMKTLGAVITRIASGDVSMSAYEARRKYYLRGSDDIIMNADKVVDVAIEKLTYLTKVNYIQRTKVNFPALGTNFKAVVEGQLDSMRLGHFISDYDMELGLAIADVMTGGELPEGTYVNQEWLQHLEKQHFLKLSKNQKTFERISHMLQTRKPLRN
ncbi:MAG TPA: enoyl-CoA hydratase/isomerase family protein [Facklamia tabacinasalis]|nr:enoyl-CoA hydratase/isomerase family protein [Ruoffia tabacinasalis]